MSRIRIGIICPSEIAFRRFMPALQKLNDSQYVGIAHANELEWFGGNNPSNNCTILHNEQDKAQNFAQMYGGRVFESYQNMLSSPDIDAVYLPLPPALHYTWGKAALEHGKHVLMEKPFTTKLEDTKELVAIAKENGLTVYENYMFQYHSQLDFIWKVMDNGDIGELRLIRIAFGFPFRGTNDFRYNKALGGGALLDCGGYTLKLASLFLGETARVVTSHLSGKDGFEVDIYGNATMVNDRGMTAQLSFGMDNSYKCEIELWGSTGTIYTNRILTAPEDFAPTVVVKTAEGEQAYNLPTDDSFAKSISTFIEQVGRLNKRCSDYSAIVKQAELVAKFGGEYTYDY